MRERANWLIRDDAGVVENSLKLGCGCAALMRCQICFTTQINGVESEAEALTGRTEFVRSNRNKRFDCLRGAAPLQSNGCVDCGQIIKLQNGVFREALGQVGGQPRSLSRITRQTQRDGRYSFDISAG